MSRVTSINLTLQLAFKYALLIFSRSTFGWFNQRYVYYECTTYTSIKLNVRILLEVPKFSWSNARFSVPAMRDIAESFLTYLLANSPVQNSYIYTYVQGHLPTIYFQAISNDNTFLYYSCGYLLYIINISTHNHELHTRELFKLLNI